MIPMWWQMHTMNILPLILNDLVRKVHPHNYVSLTTRDSVSWIYSCDKSFYITSVYSQCYVDSLKYTVQNVNNQTLTQVSQLYVHVSFCLKVIRPWLNLPICWSWSCDLHGWTNSELSSGISTSHFLTIPTDFVEIQLSHRKQSCRYWQNLSRLLRIAAPVIAKPLTSIMKYSLQHTRK